MPRIILLEKQKYDIKINNVSNYQSEEYKKIAKEADEKIRKYQDRLSRAYVNADSFIARAKTLKRK